MPEYTFKTVPMAHQLKDHEEHKDTPAWGYYYEQGAGKSKPLCDCAGHLWCEGKITALVVIAPRLVVGSWIRPEEGHLAKHLNVDYDLHRWAGGGSVAETERLKRLLVPGGRLKVLVISAGALQVGRKGLAYRYLDRFVRKHQVLLAADESGWMKNRNASRTKLMMSLANHAPYRRTLNGTPCTQRPFDVWTQTNFLDTSVFGTVYKTF